MNFSLALYQDARYRFQVVEELEQTLAHLQTFQATNPNVFEYLCLEGRTGADFTLADAIAAVEDALSVAREIDSTVDVF